MDLPCPVTHALAQSSEVNLSILFQGIYQYLRLKERTAHLVVKKVPEDSLSAKISVPGHTPKSTCDKMIGSAHLLNIDLVIQIRLSFLFHDPHPLFLPLSNQYLDIIPHKGESFANVFANLGINTETERLWMSHPVLFPVSPHRPFPHLRACEGLRNPGGLHLPAPVPRGDESKR
jgi:hypothetical protein